MSRIFSNSFMGAKCGRAQPVKIGRHHYPTRSAMVRDHFLLFGVKATLKSARALLNGAGVDMHLGGISRLRTEVRNSHKATRKPKRMSS